MWGSRRVGMSWDGVSELCPGVHGGRRESELAAGRGVVADRHGAWAGSGGCRGRDALLARAGTVTGVCGLDQKVLKSEGRQRSEARIGVI